MDATDKHQECQSPHEQCDALRMGRQMIVLDRQPHSEEKREQCEGLEVDADHQKQVQRTVKPTAIDIITQELLEDRDAELGGDIDRHHTEKGDASHDVDCDYTWAWEPGPGRIPAPGTNAEFGKLLAAWAETGAHCPVR